MKKFFLLTLFAIMSLSAFAQDVEPATTADLVWSFIVDNWVNGIGLSLIISTIIKRYWPTEKAQRLIDIIEWVYQIISWVVKLIPNRKKGGGVH